MGLKLWLSVYISEQLFKKQTKLLVNDVCIADKIFWNIASVGENK